MAIVGSSYYYGCSANFSTGSTLFNGARIAISQMGTCSADNCITISSITSNPSGYTLMCKAPRFFQAKVVQISMGLSLVMAFWASKF